MVQLSKIVQLGVVLHDIPIFGNIFLSAAKKKCFSQKFSKKILYKQIDRFHKEYITGSGITLTHNKIKDIKIINFSENRGILLKGTNRKSSSQTGEFLNFLKPLMTTGLALIYNVLTPLAKNVLSPLGLTAGASITDAAIQNKIFELGTIFNSFK